jgi:hypothetical protein
MLQEFIHTVFGLVARREFHLLREYFDLIALILSKPDEPTQQRLRIVAGDAEPKE